ncbi:uncharacterized protein LOC127282148 [Leptopilina boulardi]|uniref:uncharacterized protein LOC127282148 n=1 Tax=Leptopilina boulardi TaxID=63433 RepID=UPI0021F54375|nr:uncharacterized protein LOC127282148 [Leptopilina boulardi]
MDEGSTVTLLDDTLAKIIGVRGQRDPLQITGVGNSGTSDPSSERVDFEISALDSNVKHSIRNARTIQSLVLPSQSLSANDIQNYSHTSHLSVEPYNNVVPKLLIGQDHWDLVTSIRTMSVSRFQPVASLTKLGWVIHGQIPTRLETNNYVTVLSIDCSQENSEDSSDLHKLVKSYFSTECIGITNNSRRNKLEKRAENILSNTAKRLGSRWQVGLLWKSEGFQLPNNYQNPLTRLYSLERKMDKNATFGKRYCQQVEYLIKSGYAKRADLPPLKNPRVWYLPHFGVINHNKPDKIRLVLDASSKTKGVSLNSSLLTGPDLVCSLYGVLLRFRQKKIAFMGDIKEMFLQIKIREEDQGAQRFLWRGMNRECDPEVYVMTSMLFGATSSPCTAQYIMNKNAKDFETKYPRATKAIKNKHYVDDYLDSTDSEPEALRIIKEVTEVHKHGGFEITGWVSNNKILQSKLSANKDNDIVDLTKDHIERALGLNWNSSKDTITFNFDSRKIPDSIANKNENPTKREMLSVIMSVYDPLGILLPLTIRSKMLLQDVWRRKCAWDEKLTEEEFIRWKAWISELKNAKDYQIPRAYFNREDIPRDIELHIFSDASDKAYSAVAYLRGIFRDGSINVSFIAGKARVAPLKSLSIPRMELQGALIASRLGKTIIEELEITITRRVYWTDSLTVLGLIQADPRKYEVFVAHRLGEIDEITDIAEWNWTPSKLNPADCATKNVGNIQVLTNRWLQGPKFLCSPESMWPKQNSIDRKISCETEAKREFVTVVKENITQVLPEISHFSKYLCLIRSTSWVLVSPQRWRGNKNATLTPDLLQKAELAWIKQLQRECFGSEIQKLKDCKQLDKDSRLKDLSPVMDADGVTRIDGRIKVATDVSYDVKFPVILDGKHPFTRLLVQYYHEKFGHASPETIVNELRQKYWIIKLRPTKAKPQIPRMGDLPIERLGHHQRPFTFCGIDYFGPMLVTV